jgi:geranylgeranyl pyrophosphate synthase
MVGGQVLDIAWEKQTDTPQLADLEKVHACKTGALFRACLRIGHHVADGEKTLLACLDHYGRCFGQLFQITDDLLDVEGSAAQIGKRVQKDAERGKLTYPSFLGLPESRSRAEQLCSEARQHLQPLGERGQRLAQLVEYVLRRDH